MAETLSAADIYAAFFADEGDAHVGDATYLDSVTLDGTFDFEAIAKRLASSPTAADLDKDAEIARLRKALEFYSNGIGYTEVEDNGKTARAALTQGKD